MWRGGRAMSSFKVQSVKRGARSMKRGMLNVEAKEKT